MYRLVTGWPWHGAPALGFELPGAAPVGGGRLLVVVPNRRGVWARLDRTPFGLGSPYSLTQLNRLLRDTMFTPLQSARALFVPPGRSRMLLRSADAWEEIGSRWFPTFSGVLMIEAGKEIYAATPEPAGRRKRRRYAQVVPRANRSMRRPETIG